MSADPSLGFIPTRGSAVKKSTENQFKTVVYESYKPKRKIKVKDADGEHLPPLRPDPANTLDMKKTRYEIIKFGTSGFDRGKKEEAKVQLAIKLGAKPPRNKHVNYKVLLAERAREKAREKTKAAMQQLGKNSVGRSTAKGKSFDRKRRKEHGILDVYGQVKLKK